MISNLQRTARLSLIAAISLMWVGTALAATQTVTMKSISYEPKKLTIKVGDSVEWNNKSMTEHSATADDGKAFDTAMVQPNKVSKKIDFATAGTYPYHCSVHGKTMSGQIIVTP